MIVVASLVSPNDGGELYFQGVGPTKADAFAMMNAAVAEAATNGQWATTPPAFDHTSEHDDTYTLGGVCYLLQINEHPKGLYGCPY